MSINWKYQAIIFLIIEATTAQTSPCVDATISGKFMQSNSQSVQTGLGSPAYELLPIFQVNQKDLEP